LEHAYVHKVRTLTPRAARPHFLGVPARTFTRRLKALEALGFLAGRGRGAGRTYEVLSLVEATRNRPPAPAGPS
jgi:hypothetical protein